MIALAVVATGNHYVFDIAAGLVVSALGYGVGTVAARASTRRPAPRDRRDRAAAGVRQGLIAQADRQRERGADDRQQRARADVERGQPLG